MKKRKNKNQDSFKKALRELLFDFGENPNREGLKETPDRVWRMYKELLSGYQLKPSSVFKTFKSKGYQDLVTLTNINFYSLCEHHMIPFIGKAHIAYLPNGKILGLSKFVRLVEIFSHRLQTQENLTSQIANALEKHLKPKGLIINIEAEHLCMSMRGIKKAGCLTKTTVVRGKLKTKADLVERFYREIRKGERSENY